MPDNLKIADPSPDHVHQVTTKQLSIGGAVVTAMLVLGPFKQWFATREEYAALVERINMFQSSEEKQFSELKLFISSGQEEQVRRLERVTDKLLDRIKEAEGRVNTSIERSERRLDNIEAGRTQKGKSVY